MKKVLEIFDEEGDFSIIKRDFLKIGHHRTELTKKELENVFYEINPHKNNSLDLRDFELKLNEIKEMVNIKLVKFITRNNKRFLRIFRRIDA